MKILNRKILCSTLISLAAAVVAAKDFGLDPVNRGINVIPAPEKVEVLEGRFYLEPKMKIYVDDEGTAEMAGQFVERINRSTGYDLRLSGTPEGCRISLLLLDDPSQGESYYLESIPEHVEIYSNTVHGLYDGLCTLMQLLPAEIESPVRVPADSWSLPCVRINDAPRFSYRGVMIDVARHFFTVEEIRKQIDLFATLKINRLHLHLTDNTGWRLEVKGMPELTRKGAWRTEADGSTYGGFYTQEEIREIVAYAAERFITVVPEIDIPAHTYAANICYPQLSCTGETSSLRATWGPELVVMCPGKEYMFEWLDRLFAEIVPLFPGEYFHIGGDECPKDNWASCPDCQKRIRKLKLSNDGEFTAEEKLQSYAVCRVEKILEKYGKKIIGWDEILQGGVSRSATVMSWRGEEGGIEAAAKGNRVIMSPQDKGLYLDYYQGNAKVEPVHMAGSAYLEKTYGYEPVPGSLAAEGKEGFILGVQANMWTEYTYDLEKMETDLYPRTMALAEVAWSGKDNKDLKDFCRRLENSTRRLDLMGFAFHIPLPEMVGGPRQTVAFTDSAVVAFSTSRPVRMVWTCDGSQPHAGSRVYEGPIVLKEDAVLKVASVMENGCMSPVLSYKVCRQEPRHAERTSTDGLEKGLVMRRLPDGEDQVIAGLEAIADFSSHPKTVREVEVYTTVTEGYLEIGQEGIYTFSTNFNRLWIGDELVVDNEGEVKRSSRKDSSIALGAGLHRIRIEFKSDYIGGFASWWDRKTVALRRDGQKGFRDIDGGMLWH